MEKLKQNNLLDMASVEVERLIGLLDEYIIAAKKRDGVNKGLRFDGVDWRIEYNQYNREAQELSDGIIFENPLVWLLYKRRAYTREDRSIAANGGEEIATLQNLIKHTNNDGVCAKRFHFLNQFWRERFGGKSIEEYVAEHGSPSDLDLEELAASKEFLELTQILIESGEWNGHEYFSEDKTVKKWGNYTRD
jgi:hypothetical protein